MKFAILLVAWANSLLEAALKIDEPFTFKNGHVVKKIKLYGYEKEMDEKWFN